MAPVLCQAERTVASESLECHFVTCNQPLKQQPKVLGLFGTHIRQLLLLLLAGYLVAAC